MLKSRYPPHFLNFNCFQMNSIRNMFHLVSFALTLLFFSSSFGRSCADCQMGTCSNDNTVCTLDYSTQLKPWMHGLYERTVACRGIAETHPFIIAVGAGEVSKAALLYYFQGMYWHGKMCDQYPVPSQSLTNFPVM